MPLIKDGRFAWDDWPERDLRWIAPDDLARHDGEAGVALDNTQDVTALAPHFDRVALIRLDFPGFADGRAFSQAARLRRLGYRGRLRAAGPLLPDQYRAAVLAGFDEIELPDALAERFGEEQWRRAATRPTVTYRDKFTGKVA